MYRFTPKYVPQFWNLEMFVFIVTCLTSIVSSLCCVCTFNYRIYKHKPEYVTFLNPSGHPNLSLQVIFVSDIQATKKS